MKVEILISPVNQGEIYRYLPINDGGYIDSLLPTPHKWKQDILVPPH